VEPDPLVERLAMFLVVRWIDEGRPDDGRVPLSVPEAAERLELGEDRRTILGVMAALGHLEDEGRVRVEWPGGTGMPAHVSLRGSLRREADALFGT
jgi:hypothetical protein